MAISEHIRAFGRDTSGAVTTDWVMLTALCIGMALAVVASISDGADAVAATSSTAIAATQVGGL